MNTDLKLNSLVFPSDRDFYFLDIENSCFISVDTDKIIKLCPAELTYFRNISLLKPTFPIDFEDIEVIKCT